MAGKPGDSCSSIFSSTAGILSSSLEDRGLPEAQRDQVVSTVVDSAGAAISGLADNPQTAEIGADAKQAFSDGTRLAAFTAAGFLVIGLVATIPLGRSRREGDAEGAARTAGQAGARGAGAGAGASEAGASEAGASDQKGAGAPTES